MLALVAAVWTVISAASNPRITAHEHVAQGGQVSLLVGHRPVASFEPADYTSDGRLQTRRLAAAVRAALPTRGVTRAGYGTQAVRYLRSRTAVQVVAQMQAGGGRVLARRRAIASVIEVPVRKQSMRNDCESAAMSLMLEALGKRVSQDRLQAMFPRSGPLDPQGSGPARVWGDPELGFVGRSQGGGVAGGFGIYPPPLVSVGQRLGVKLRDLTGASADAIYSRLLAGLPVMVWVGLSDGPYGEWQSPEGRHVRANFGEHTVVLAGLDRDGSVRVSNPLQGTRERWSAARFSSMWQRLGRRALGPVR